MAIEVFNRVEKKYLLDNRVYEMLLHKLEDYMEVDVYNKGNKLYSIANIYYDTPSDPYRAV